MTKCSRKKRTMLLTALAAAAVFSGGVSGKAFAAETVAGEESVSAEQTVIGEEDYTDDKDTDDKDTDEIEEKSDDDTEEEADSDVKTTDSEVNPGVSADTDSISDTEDTADTGSMSEATDDSKESVTSDFAEDVDDSSDIQTAEEKTSDPLLVPGTSETDGWYQEGSDYYYYLNGKLVKDKVLEIKGQLYCFYSSGKMVKNSTYYVVNKDTNKYEYFRAKENGMLYRSAWYQDAYGDWFYYGADGAAAHGIATVGGKKYLFDYRGLLMIGMAEYVDGVAYAGTNDGQPKKLKNDGWDQAGGQWFYMVGGKYKENTLDKIDGAYYIFQEYGQMLKAGESYTISSYDSMTSSYTYLHYRAKDGGKLCRNEWFYNEQMSGWVYYGAGCAALTGYQKIGDYYYLFDKSDGKMIRNMAAKWSDGYCYVVDSEGHASRMPKNGWGKCGLKYYYMRDGAFVSGEVIEINGKLYGFDSYYYAMYSETSFSAKITVDGVSVNGNFRAKADGSLYVNEWYRSLDGTWYYYGGDGRAVSGIRKVGGNTYYFSGSGAMNTSTWTTDSEGKLWAVSSKGTAVMVPKNDWASVEGNWYYNEDGSLVRNATRTIGGKMYFFNSYGVMLKNQKIYTIPVHYRAGKDGVLYRNQWYGYEYYMDNGKAADGLYSVDGTNYYYFVGGIAQRNGYFVSDIYLYYAGSNGIVSKVTKDGLYYTDEYGSPYIVKNGVLDQEEGWKKINGKYYYVEWEGKAYYDIKIEIDDAYYIFNQDGSLVTGGWVAYDQDFYYAKGSGELLTGSQKIGNKWYYFSGTGAMRTGVISIDQVLYLYGEDGAYVGKIKEGWNELDGYWYYLKDGKLLTGEQQIGKARYYFDYGGMMRTNYVSGDSDYRIWGEDGKLVTGGWVQIRGTWYYVDPETGKYLRSVTFHEINGKKYSFGSFGGLQFTEYYDQYSGILYGTDSTGAVVEKGKQNGTWVAVNGSYYYKDYSYTGWVGDYYVSYGRMLTDTVVSGILIGHDGKKITKQGWYNSDQSNYGEPVNCWFYVKADGKAANSEWVKIDGKWYYFFGRAMVDEPFISDEKLYLINGKGQLEKTIDHPDDGWYSVDGKWYYVNSMTISYACAVKNTGTIFYTDRETREMVTNKVAGDYSDGFYYFDKNGKADRSLRGWKKIGGYWNYFDQNGRAVIGWVNVNSKIYFIGYGIGDGYGMLTGYYVIDGKLYQFGSDGAMISQVKYKEGWVEKDGNWFYMYHGEAVANDIMYINGKYFAFDRYGRMIKNSFMEDGNYYAGSDGALITNGWKKIGGSWYYFNRFGYKQKGWQNINGKVYLFDVAGKLIQ